MVHSTFIPRLKVIAAAAGLLAVVMPASALKIDLINLNNVTPGTDAYYGFTQASRFWEMAITNPVTVKLNVGFSQLNPGVLGSTGSTTNVAYVGDLLPALAASGNSKLDSIVAANMPKTRASAYVGGQALDALISAPKANGNGVALPLNRVLDADAGANNSAFSANTSLLKAIGITPSYVPSNPNQADGTIQFSNQFAFDFDPTNGIDVNKIDFIGVAIHEIGHALGFRSGVDAYDVNAGAGANLGNYAWMSIWDIFRYSAQSAALGVNDWAVGGTAAAGNAPYFSIDGGKTVYNGDAYFSTGRTNGDGRQASHWKDNAAGTEQLGAMDPTVAYGQQTIIETLDLAAMDAMGWNVAYDVMNYYPSFSTRDIPNLSELPEPGTITLLALALGIGAGVSRRRKEQAAAKV